MTIHEIAKEYGYSIEMTTLGEVAVQPGFWCRDEIGDERHYLNLTSREAAKEYAGNGEYGDPTITHFVDVRTWRLGFMVDEKGKERDVYLDEIWHHVEIAPMESV